MTAGEQGSTRAPGAWATTHGPYLLVLVLSVLLALWGLFLVPFRVGGTLVPVSWVIAVGGNLAVGRAGGALLGTTGALLPGLLWLSVVGLLSTRGPGGDVLLTSGAGLVFLGLGLLASIAVFFLAATRPRPRG